MHKLIYNTVSGNFQTFSSLDPKLQKIVSASPFFMVDSNENVILAPTTTALLTSHLYSLETMVDITRRAVATDTTSIIEKTLTATSKLDEIRTTELILRTLQSWGIDKEFILKMMDNAIERVPKSSPEKTAMPEEFTLTHYDEKTIPVDNIISPSNQENTEPVLKKEEKTDVWELNE